MPKTDEALPGLGRDSASGNGAQAAKLNAPRDTKSPDEIKCKRCGRAFVRERVEQKYCCARCRNAAVKARLRARSGDTKPRKRHLLLPHQDAVTFGQKRPTKSKAIFDPQPRDFRRPVIDFLHRKSFELGAAKPVDMVRLVIAVECKNYPARYRRPREGE